jgi:hypothetical protein
MLSKAAQIAALLRNKTVFYVNIETSGGQDSITETTLESPEGAASGIAVAVEDDTITFKTDDKIASFLKEQNRQHCAPVVLSGRIGFTVFWRFFVDFFYNIEYRNILTFI